MVGLLAALYRNHTGRMKSYRIVSIRIEIVSEEVQQAKFLEGAPSSCLRERRDEKKKETRGKCIPFSCNVARYCIVPHRIPSNIALHRLVSFALCDLLCTSVPTVSRQIPLHRLVSFTFYVLLRTSVPTVSRHRSERKGKRPAPFRRSTHRRCCWCRSCRRRRSSVTTRSRLSSTVLCRLDISLVTDCHISPCFGSALTQRSLTALATAPWLLLLVLLLASFLPLFCWSS